MLRRLPWPLEPLLRLQEGHSHVPLMDKGQTIMLDVNCNMLIIDGFSGHSDRNQLMDYVSALNPTPEDNLPSR